MESVYLVWSTEEYDGPWLLEIHRTKATAEMAVEEYTKEYMKGVHSRGPELSYYTSQVFFTA